MTIETVKARIAALEAELAAAKAELAELEAAAPAVDTLDIEVSHEGTAYEQHEVILRKANGDALNVSYARTPRGAKMCLSRYAKANGFTKGKDGNWTRPAK